MTAARKPCAWHAAALEFGQKNKSFMAIDPRSNPKAWSAWRDYFRWLNWAPHWFVQVERLHDEKHDSEASWTAPIDHPDKFTLTFQPMKGPPPVFPLTIAKPPIGALAGHVDRLRAEGKLTYDDPERDLRKPWWQRLTRSSAQANLDRLEREATQQLAHDEAAE